MIFSSAKWNDADELKEFIPVSSALTFENLQSSLSDAQDLFVRPLLGDTLTAVVEKIYAAETRSDVERQLLHLCQQAVANLAFWYNFDVLNSSITDQGFQRQESDTFKGIYKYQADRLRANFRNKGFNALDSVLDFLELHTDTFTDFLSSPGYTVRRSAIIRSASEANDVYFINSSRIIFLRLQPFIRTVQTTDLTLLLGSELYRKLLQNLADGTTVMNDTTTEELRLQCCQYVTMRAVSMLMKATGSITDRGLYFESVLGGREDSGNESSQPVSKDTLAMELDQVDATAERYGEMLASFVQLHLPDYCKVRPSDVLKRDNTDKPTVWL